MYVDFEIAALFPSQYTRVRKGHNFKTNIHLDSVESFLTYLSSNSRVIVAFEMKTFRHILIRKCNISSSKDVSYANLYFTKIVCNS